ncbi:MAG: hypothetical protein WBL84_19605 [Xanthobacteraceae bacterium]
MAAVDQPLQGFGDFVRWKFALEPANELANASSTLNDRGRQRAIEFAVKEELAVLGIEAHDVGRQCINGEIRRELRDFFAVALCKACPAVACHEIGTRTFATRRRGNRSGTQTTGRRLGRAFLDPAITMRAGQRNRRARKSSTSGKLPMTHNSHSRSLHSLCILGRLCSRNLCSLCNPTQVARQPEVSGHFPCRTHRMSPS